MEGTRKKNRKINKCLACLQYSSLTSSSLSRFLFLFVCFMVWGIESRSAYMLSTCSTIEPYPQPYLLIFLSNWTSLQSLLEVICSVESFLYPFTLEIFHPKLTCTQGQFHSVLCTLMCDHMYCILVLLLLRKSFLLLD